MLSIANAKKNIKAYVEPVFRQFGIQLNCISIIDVDLAKEIFIKGDLAHGERPLKGFFATVFQWRKLQKKRGHEYLSGDEIGLLRDLDPNDPDSTAKFRHGRRRVMEYTAKKDVTKETIYFIGEVGDELTEFIKKAGDKGVGQHIDSRFFIIIVEIPFSKAKLLSQCLNFISEQLFRSFLVLQ